MHYSDALDEIVDAIARAAGRSLYDWIDGPGEYHEGLGHCDPRQRDTSLFTIDVSIATDFLSEQEVEALDARMHAVADEHGIAVDLTETTADHCVYHFNVHAMFVQSPTAYA